MKERLTIVFFILALLSGVLWVGGWVAVAVFSWVDGDLAKRLGSIGAFAAIGGELLIWILAFLGWLVEPARQKALLPVKKKYGNKPSA